MGVLQLADQERNLLFDLRNAFVQVPYKTRYLQQAARVRDTIGFSYQHGRASLLDFLQVQQDYRGIQLSYLNLASAFLSAANLTIPFPSCLASICLDIRNMPANLLSLGALDFGMIADGAAVMRPPSS